MNTLSLLATTDYSYSYSSTDTSSATSAVAGLIVGLIGFVVALAVYALVAWLTSRIFKKAGVAAWKAWVPVYNTWITLELGGQAGWWAVLAFIPIVNIVAAIILYIAMYNIGLKLGKSGAFVLWAIFFSPVWYVWLAIDDSTWNDGVGAPSRLAMTPVTTSETPSVPPTATL